MELTFRKNLQSVHLGIFSLLFPLPSMLGTNFYTSPMLNCMCLKSGMFVLCFSASASRKSLQLTSNNISSHTFTQQFDGRKIILSQNNVHWLPTTLGKKNGIISPLLLTFLLSLNQTPSQSSLLSLHVNSAVSLMMASTSDKPQTNWTPGSRNKC